VPWQAAQDAAQLRTCSGSDWACAMVDSVISAVAVKVIFKFMKAPQ
jgi:hypothetical protein